MLQPKPKSIQARRKLKLPWKKIFLRCCGLLLLVAIIVGSHWIYQVTKARNAPIKHVKIVATFAHLNSEMLQKTVIPYVSNGFFYLNVFGLKQKLLNIPWVYAAAVQREWPDTVVITIVEQTPVARWGNKGLFNAEGKMYYADPSTFPVNIPLLLGPADQAVNVFQQYHVMGKMLLALNCSIGQLLLSPQHFWHLILNNGTEIFVSESNALEQLKLLVKLYPKIMLNHNKSPLLIDMRYGNGIAVKWDENSNATALDKTPVS